jgi:hypothetical protein
VHLRNAECNNQASIFSWRANLHHFMLTEKAFSASSHTTAKLVIGMFCICSVCSARNVNGPVPGPQEQAVLNRSEMQSSKTLRKIQCQWEGCDAILYCTDNLDKHLHSHLNDNVHSPSQSNKVFHTFVLNVCGCLLFVFQGAYLSLVRVLLVFISVE